MYIVVFVEECSMGMCSIAGVGYRVEQWGGKWDGMMGVANSCIWCCCSRLCWLLYV